jgi:hypothetical protein
MAICLSSGFFLYIDFGNSEHMHLCAILKYMWRPEELSGECTHWQAASMAHVKVTLYHVDLAWNSSVCTA